MRPYAASRVSICPSNSAAFARISENRSLVTKRLRRNCHREQCPKEVIEGIVGMLFTPPHGPNSPLTSNLGGISPVHVHDVWGGGMNEAGVGFSDYLFHQIGAGGSFGPVLIRVDKCPYLLAWHHAST